MNFNARASKEQQDKCKFAEFPESNEFVISSDKEGKIQNGLPAVYTKQTTENPVIKSCWLLICP
jgi:hypothetical protein